MPENQPKTLAKTPGNKSSLAIGMYFALVLGLLVLPLSHLSHVVFGDTLIYRQYAASIAHGNFPYLKQFIEYPPGVLPFMLLPYYLPISSYVAGFILICCIAVGIYLAHRYKSGGVRDVAIVCLMLLPLLQFAYLELDIFAAVLAYFSIVYIKRAKYVISAILLSLATLIKAYPAILILILFWQVPSRKRLKFIGWFILVSLIGLIPFLIIAPHGLYHALTYQAGRHIEFEASSALVGYVEHAFRVPVHLKDSHAGIQMYFSGQSLTGVLSSGLLIISLITLSFMRLKNWLKPKIALLSLIAVLLFLLLFKVGSPQYFLLFLLIAPLAKNELPNKDYLALVKRSLIYGVTILLLFFSQFSISQIGDINGWHGIITLMLAVLRLLILIELIVFLFKRLINKRAVKAGVLGRAHETKV